MVREGGVAGMTSASSSQDDDLAQPIRSQHPEVWPIRGQSWHCWLVTHRPGGNTERRISQSKTIWIAASLLFLSRCVVIVVRTLGLRFTAMLCYAQVFLTHRGLSRWIIFLIKIQIWSVQWVVTAQLCQLQDAERVRLRSGDPRTILDSLHRVFLVLLDTEEPYIQSAVPCNSVIMVTRGRISSMLWCCLIVSG